MLNAGGLTGMVISLDPPSLGHIKLDIVTDSSRITGKIVVESNEVKNLIQDNLYQLQQALSDNGLTVESFDVQVGNNGNSNSWENTESYKNALKLMNDSIVSGISDTDVDISEETHSVRRMPGSGIIDYLV